MSAKAKVMMLEARPFDPGDLTGRRRELLRKARASRIGSRKKKNSSLRNLRDGIVQNMHRILIADHNATLRSLLRLYLSDAANDVVEAWDAPSAFRLASSEPLDLVLFELMLPGRSGSFAVQKICSQRGILTVLMSTLNVREAADLIADADDYFQKPFRIGDAMRRVEALLARNSRLEPVDRPGANASPPMRTS